jgi:hypothetical protein
MPRKSHLQAAPVPQEQESTLIDPGQIVTVRRQISYDEVESKLALLTHLVGACVYGRHSRLDPSDDVGYGIAIILRELHHDLRDLNAILGSQDTDAVIGTGGAR